MHLMILTVNRIKSLETSIILQFPFEGAEAQSQLRRPGESELDYYERRYQERVSQSEVSDRFSLILLHLATPISRHSCTAESIRYKCAINHRYTN